MAQAGERDANGQLFSGGAGGGGGVFAFMDDVAFQFPWPSDLSCEFFPGLGSGEGGGVSAQQGVCQKVNKDTQATQNFQ